MKVFPLIFVICCLVLNDYHVLEPRNSDNVRLEIGNDGTECDVWEKTFHV